MIRYATTEDIYALKRLWDTGFDDSLNYINFIFDRVSSPDDILIYDLSGSVAGMLTLLPVKFKYRDEAVDATYVFGATTDKRFRNRGVMTHLLANAEAEAKQRGSKLMVLVPGEKALVSYYKRRGYNSNFFLRDIEILPGMLSEIPTADTSLEYDTISDVTMHSLRESALYHIPHISWESNQLRFVLDDCYIYGDNSVYYKGAYGESYAVYNVMKNRVYVKECLGSNDKAQMILLKEIILQNGVKSAVVRQPLKSTLFEHEGVHNEYGMVKPLYIESYIGDLDGYMNLMLD